MSSRPRAYYSLTDQQVKKLVRDFLWTVKKPASRFGCYMIPGTDKYSDLGRHVEGQVFYEIFRNDAKVMVKEYGPYEDASILFVVIDHNTEMPVGALRVIEHSDAGLKTHIDLVNTPLRIKPEHVYKTYDVAPPEVVDIGTLAVDKAYRGRKYDFIPSLLLYRALYTEVITNPKNRMMVSIIDEKPYLQLLRLGMPFKPILNSSHFPYIDSEKSYAVYAYTSEFLPSVRRKTRLYLLSISPTHQYMRRMMRKLMHGKGLDHMMGYAK
jgi:hypothetical protein